MWLYSVSEWCSPNHAYFQFERSRDDVLGLSVQHRVLARRVVGRRPRQVAVDVDPELHRVSFHRVPGATPRRALGEKLEQVLPFVKVVRSKRWCSPSSVVSAPSRPAARRDQHGHPPDRSSGRSAAGRAVGHSRGTRPRAPAAGAEEPGPPWPFAEVKAASGSDDGTQRADGHPQVVEHLEVRAGERPSVVR